MKRETKISPKLRLFCSLLLITFHEQNTCGDAAPRFQFLITVSWEICQRYVLQRGSTYMCTHRSAVGLTTVGVPTHFIFECALLNTYVTNPFIFGCFIYLGMALKSTLVDNPEVGHRPRPLFASVTLSLHLGSSHRCVFLRQLLVSLSYKLYAPVSDRSSLNAVGRPPFAGHLLWGFFPEAEDSPWYVLTFLRVGKSIPISMGYLHSNMHRITILVSHQLVLFLIRIWPLDK